VKAEAELAQEKQHLETAKHELDLLQRDFDLHRQQFYSDPAIPRTQREGGPGSAGRTSGAKRQEVQQIEQKIAALANKLDSMTHELGAKKEEPITPEKERDAFVARVRRCARSSSALKLRYNASAPKQMAEDDSLRRYGWGSMTANQLQQLENRRANLLSRIAALEDEAAAPVYLLAGSANLPHGIAEDTRSS